LRLILSGEVAAAAVDSTVLEAELAHYPELAAQLRCIAVLGPSPAPPWVISRCLPAHLSDGIRQCVSGMCADAAGRRILQSWRIAELRAVGDAAYDPIRVMARSATAAWNGRSFVPAGADILPRQ
jgi:phosphonate transport system substrate-binding protein